VKVVSQNYQQGLRVWNRDMIVDAAAIRVVLEDSSDPKAKSGDPNRFLTIRSSRRSIVGYAVKLFPAGRVNCQAFAGVEPRRA
jgi:hypothetical protein